MKKNAGKKFNLNNQQRHSRGVFFALMKKPAI